MSEILNCDPNKGFVAFPVALFDLELTPGAFRTLAELCRMANTSGQCWPSLAQLGRKLGRSRASVSAYISELRKAGVLSTEEQKMANGYNYRLRYTVTFWKEWRLGLGGEQKAASCQKPQRSERRVQPDVRPLETKNHIHKNQLESSNSLGLVSKWKEKVQSAPYPSFAKEPDAHLLSKTEDALRDTTPQKAPISADIETRFREFCVNRNLTGDVGEVAVKIAPLVTSHDTLDQLMSTLAEIWQDHWRKSPNAYQVIRLIEALAPSNSAHTEQKLLKSYLQRWKLYQRSLPSPAIGSTVAA